MLHQPAYLCRYFGAAKQLPGVKELFEKEAPKQVRPHLAGRQAGRRTALGQHPRSHRGLIAVVG